MENQQQTHVEEPVKETFFDKLYNLKWGGVYTAFYWGSGWGRMIIVEVKQKTAKSETLITPPESITIPGKLHLKYIDLVIQGPISSDDFKKILSAIEATTPIYANGKWRAVEAAALVKFDGHLRAQ